MHLWNTTDYTNLGKPSKWRWRKIWRKKCGNEDKEEVSIFMPIVFFFSIIIEKRKAIGDIYIYIYTYIYILYIHIESKCRKLQILKLIYNVL